jgi:hypothetical protein
MMHIQPGSLVIARTEGSLAMRIVVYDNEWKFDASSWVYDDQAGPNIVIAALTALSYAGRRLEGIVQSPVYVLFSGGIGWDQRSNFVLEIP